MQSYMVNPHISVPFCLKLPETVYQLPINHIFTLFFSVISVHIDHVDSVFANYPCVG